MRYNLHTDRETVTIYVPALKIGATFYRSPHDGAVHVGIESQADTGEINIGLNDADVWVGDPEQW